MRALLIFCFVILGCGQTDVGKLRSDLYRTEMLWQESETKAQKWEKRYWVLLDKCELQKATHHLDWIDPGSGVAGEKQ